jgi:putative ABC transport system permease protein
MTFSALILKNLWRHKTRTLLTLLGISIGIATILMLGAVADGMGASFSGIMNSGGSDITVAQADSSDISFSIIDAARVDEIRALPGVERADGTLMSMTQLGANPFFIVFGSEPGALTLKDIRPTEGRMFAAPDEIVLGKIAARSTGKTVGDTLVVFEREFTVVGVYETGENMKDGGGLAPLASMQQTTDRVGKVTLVSVKVEDAADVGTVARSIERTGGLVTITSVAEISKADKGMDTINAASWLISALAIVIGGIGVMNTMIISVYDRVREIGVLKALGWRRRSIIRLILSESAAIGLGSVVVGTLIAVPILKLVSLAPAVQSFLTPAYSPGLWLQATLVAVLVAVIGGLYPAYRAANLSPVEALRYE